MDEKSKITELTDSEFLSFLYSERERENSIRKYQGWNIWILCGAIVTVVIAGYNVLKNSFNIISPLPTIYCVSGIFAFILCYRPIILLFDKRKIVDYSKVKFLKNTAPYFFLVLSVILSLSFSFLIPLFDISNPLNIVSIVWMISFILFVIALAYTVVYREKIVCSYLDGMVFYNQKLDSCFWAGIGGLLSIVWTKSFCSISTSFIGTPGFELSFCIVTVILLIYMLIKVWLGEKKGGMIDLLIDDFLYKHTSKEHVFWILRINKLGHSAMESCANEINEILNILSEYEQNKDKIIEIGDQFEKEKVDMDKFYQYYETILEVRNIVDKCIHQSDKLGTKINQIESQVPSLGTNEDYKILLYIYNLLLSKENDFLKVTNKSTNNMMLWLNNYYCNKYGGFCVKECEKRHEKPGASLLFARFLKRTKRRLIERCRRS